MASPQKYAAWARRQKRQAHQAEQLAELIAPGMRLNLPFHAIHEGVAIETRKGSVEAKELASMETLAEGVARTIKGGETTNSTISPELPERYMIINTWLAKRFRNGMLEHNRITICVENFEDPPREWRKTFKQEGWLPRYRHSTNMLIQSAIRANYQYAFAEKAAHKKLRGLIEPYEYERYVLAGVLPFVGKDGVQYLIRKGRPTLAFRIAPSLTQKGKETYYPLASMCTHPAGYFARTWTGILPPTDDVIAHLLWLRQGEHEFWKRCEQHHFDEVEAGI